MDYCKFHPNKVAHVRCKTCFTPLCEDCKVVTEIGVFCSEECLEKAKEFQNRVRPDTPRIKHPSFFGFIFKILAIVVLILAIALGLDYLDIVTLPLVPALKDLLGLTF